MKKSVVFLSFVLLLMSCKKMALKQPVETDITFSTIIDESETSLINIQHSKMFVDKVRLIGTRIEGPSIDFERLYNEPIDIDFDGVTAIKDLDFDLPQGDYTSLKFQLGTQSNSVFNFSTMGKYKLSSGPAVDVVFELNADEMFELEVAQEFELDKKEPVIFDMQLNLMHWMDALTTTDLDNADLITYNSGLGLGNSTILINSSNNTELYQKIIDRISGQNQVEIK